MANSDLVVYTKLSPYCTMPRKNPIDTITIHMTQSQCTAESLGEWFVNPKSESSSNYGVDKNGRIGLYVEEANRSWASGTGNYPNTNDHRSITIEVASNERPPYAVTEKAYKALIELCVDICKRHGKSKFVFLGNRADTEAAWAKNDTETMYLTAHKWFASTDCPGEWLYSRFGEIAKKVTDALNPKVEPTQPTITFPVDSVQKGSKGEHVKRVQIILKGLGLYNGYVDGDCGNLTVASILEYQKRNGLYEDGVFGIKCWSRFLDLD